MLTYPATITLSTRSLNHLAELLRAHRTRRGTRYRRLDPGRQALLVLAHLRNGDTPARLAGGFGVGATTAWRYIREAVDLLAAQAPALPQAMQRIGRLAYAILDGTLIRTDRISGKQHRRHYAAKKNCASSGAPPRPPPNVRTRPAAAAASTSRYRPPPVNRSATANTSTARPRSAGPRRRTGRPRSCAARPAVRVRNARPYPRSDAQNVAGDCYATSCIAGSPVWHWNTRFSSRC